MADEINFTEEAKQWLADVSFALNYGQLSDTLSSSDSVAFMNLTTRENQEFCVQLDKSGFKVITIIVVLVWSVFGGSSALNFFCLQVVGEAHNEVTDSDEARVFETVYALMEHISPSYPQQFGGKLTSSLEQLKNTGHT